MKIKQSMLFSTELFPPDWIDCQYSPSIVNIQPGLPENLDFWDITKLSSFLNEMIDFHKHKQKQQKPFCLQK